MLSIPNFLPNLVRIRGQKIGGAAQKATMEDVKPSEIKISITNPRIFVLIRSFNNSTNHMHFGKRRVPRRRACIIKYCALLFSSTGNDTQGGTYSSNQKVAWWRSYYGLRFKHYSESLGKLKKPDISNNQSWCKSSLKAKTLQFGE
jgi:hypothetical protein